MKISKNGKDYLERIQVDTRKGVERSQLLEASSGKSAGETVYDFNRVSGHNLRIHFTDFCRPHLTVDVFLPIDGK